MFERAREDVHRELVDVLDDEKVAIRTPRDDVGQRTVLQYATTRRPKVRRVNERRRQRMTK